jgi:hypothetical protein
VSPHMTALVETHCIASNTCLPQRGWTATTRYRLRLAQAVD